MILFILIKVDMQRKLLNTIFILSFERQKISEKKATIYPNIFFL